MAATHFQPTFARAAFPCFDEPQFKARFKVSIYRDRFHIALFNMPVINTEEAGFFMGSGLVSWSRVDGAVRAPRYLEDHHRYQS